MLKTLTLTTLVLSFVLSSAFAQQKPLPQEDPTREWLGNEYAEAIFGDFKKRYPKIKLTIDPKDLVWFRDGGLRKDNETYFGKILSQIKTGLGAVGVAAIRGLLPETFQTLTTHLELGEPMAISPLQNSKMDDAAEMRLQLLEWILSHEAGTIYPHDLMVEALHVTRGRVILAWGLCWNILSQDWVNAATRNYGSITQRMFSVTGERHLWQGAAQYVVLPTNEKLAGKAWLDDESEEHESRRFLEMHITKRGDDFSAFYHRVGVELLTLVTSSLTESSLAGSTLGSMGALGERFKYVKTAGLETENIKRINIDLASADSGAHFYDLVLGNEKLSKGYSASAEKYFRSNSETYGREYQLKGRPPIYFGMNVDSKYWAPVMSVKELKLRFFHSRFYDQKVFQAAILLSTGDSDRLHRGLVQYMNEGAGDAELNALIKDYLNGIRSEPVENDVKVDLSLNENVDSRFAQAAGADYTFDQYRARLESLLQRVLLTGAPRSCAKSLHR